jgi:hypothetical protein
MNIKTLTVAMLLVVVLGTMLVMPATAATATRTLPGDCVSAGAEFTVTITAEEYGSVGAVTETLCGDWDYVSVTGAVDDVQIDGNNVKFLLLGSGPRTFTYTVSAPAEVGCCQISGTLRLEAVHERSHTLFRHPLRWVAARSAEPSETMIRRTIRSSGIRRSVSVMV